MILFIRTIILFILVMLVMRLMGKRQIGELQPYEFTITLMISELAVMPMQNTGVPILNGMIPMLTLLFLQMATSFLLIKSIAIRNLICGKPTILIEKGTINLENLKKELYNINDLLEQLRSNGTASVKDVSWAIIESNGELSVIPNNTDGSSQGNELPVEVIVDGKIIYENLKFRGYTEEWLIDRLHKSHINNVREVFFASLESDNSVFVQTYVKRKVICE